LSSPHLAIDRLERVLSVAESFGLSLFLDFWKGVDILAAVKRTAIPHHATFLGWSLNGVDASPKNA
jgi:hypothetical protein